MSGTIRERKIILRAQMIPRRAAVPDEIQKKVGQKIIDTLLAGMPPIPEIRRGTVLGLYASIDGEPDFSGSLPELLRRGIVCCYPAVIDGRVIFRAVCDTEDFSIGMFGIREPGPRSGTIAGEQIDVLLVPGLCFDRTGCRLGRGKGFYDRYLSRIDPQRKPFTIGTGYAFQMVDEVPARPGDVPMDYLILP